MNKIMMGVDVASMKNVATGQVAYDTVSQTVLMWDGNMWRYVNYDKDVENKFEKRKRIIAKLLSEK